MERQQESGLEGKVVVITGASRGVGRQAALDFARRGARVVLAARTVDPQTGTPGTLGETLREIEALGGEALAVPTDLSRIEDLHRLIDCSVERFGGVDILINNAALTTGPIWNKTFMELSLDEWRQQFAVNVDAPFVLMQRVVPIMEQRGGGRIINVTTGSAEVMRLPEETPLPEGSMGKPLRIPGYFASKRALDRLASVIAPDLIPKGIYIIGVMPGWVATEIVQARLAEQDSSPGEYGPVPTAVPSRMLVYFAACENPAEYAGRIFFAEREMADMGIPL